MQQFPTVLKTCLLAPESKLVMECQQTKQREDMLWLGWDTPVLLTLGTEFGRHWCDHYESRLKSQALFKTQFWLTLGKCFLLPNSGCVTSEMQPRIPGGSEDQVR